MYSPADFEGGGTGVGDEDDELEERYMAEQRPVRREWSRCVPHSASRWT